MSEISYVISKGDTLGAIASRFQTTVHSIVRVNPVIANANLIQIGWKLRMPDGAKIPTQNPIIRTLYSGPQSLGCGGVIWRVEFELPEKAGADGWIIQKISRTYQIKNPDDSVYDVDLQSAKWTYFEAWRVKKGETKTSDRFAATADGVTYDDEFSQPKRPNSRGEFKVRAIAKFYEVALPSTFRKNNSITRALDLPSTVHFPDFWDDDGTQHDLTVTWDCTPCAGSSASPCPYSRITTKTSR